MELVVLLGAPGAGKGTVAERIRDVGGYCHVSTGDMLRAAVKAGSEVGREADGYMRRGELVPDQVMIRIIEERLDGGKDGDRYLFDGFPRTTAQAELLENSLAKRAGELGSVLLLEAPRAVLIQRLTGRRICRSCGTNYHVLNMPPAREDICDACGGELYQRPDDNEETIVNRLEVYQKQTQSLISRYEEKGLLSRLNSDQPVDELLAEIRAVLKLDETVAAGRA